MPHLRRLSITALVAFVAGGVTHSARAEIIIAPVGTVSLTPGGTATMDFTISATAGETLSAFNVEFLITPVGGSNPLLQFTDSQPDPTMKANYVFNPSFASDNSIPVLYPPTTTNTSNDTITGFDMSDSALGYVTLPTSGSPAYLVGLQFTLLSGAGVGNSYHIALVSDPSQTYFTDGNGDNYASSDISSTYGLVTVASVPEPASIVSCLAGLGILAVRYLKKRPGGGAA